LVQQKILNANAQIVSPIEQHRLSLRQALTNVFGHSAAERLFDVPSDKLFVQRFDGRNA
jgi:hypothetical protein